MRNYAFLSMLKKYINSSVILVVVTVAALIVANSPWGDSYRDLWELPVNVSVGKFNLFSHSAQELSLLDFINDFLMAIFFFSIGLEIKREILVGELSSLRKALLPIIGACGGMLIPVVIFFVLCPDDASMLRGTAIPMATDIAFSLGVLAIFGQRVPASLKIFLATLAVADDLGGIIVIALFYSTNLHLHYLGYTAILILILLIGNWLHLRSKTFYIGVGIFVWYMFLNSGIHATIAGVVVAFCVPARPNASALYFVASIRRKLKRFPTEEAVQDRHGISILSNNQIYLLKSIESASDRIISPLQSLEDALQNPINYFVVPLFAFANAGIDMDGMSIDNLFSGISLAVFMGLAIGKFAGIFSFSWLAIKCKLVSLPEGCSWKSFASVCMLGGIGFTVSMFIADLSYYPLGEIGKIYLNNAKIGILAGSVASSLISIILLNHTLPRVSSPSISSDTPEKENKKHVSSPAAN